MVCIFCFFEPRDRTKSNDMAHITRAGLNLDDTSLHADRIKLWNDFNHAWLALGHRQIELMISSQQPLRAQTVMSKSMVKKMGDELIRLCDGIERHGLIDYQYGVWEEQITTGMCDSIRPQTPAQLTRSPQCSKIVWISTNPPRRRAVVADPAEATGRQ